VRSMPTGTRPRRPHRLTDKPPACSGFFSGGNLALRKPDRHRPFAFVRVVATHPVRNNNLPPREEWLIIEWPAGDDAPSDYWLSNLPEDARRERLARLARLRWTIELDYRQLKGELGLDHYEGRSYAGFHHHCALVTCAHAFLTLERRDPKAPRPA
jgi:SRSO17 transposase